MFKSIHNWRRYPSSKFYEIHENCGSEFGGLLCRHLTPQRKIAITTVPLVHNTPKKSFGKFTSCMTWCAQTCSFRAIFGLQMRILTTAVSAIIATRGKNLYRCTSTFRALKYRGEFKKNLSAIYTKWCAQTFLPIWGVFAFSTTISRKLWHHLATKMRTM